MPLTIEEMQDESFDNSEAHGFHADGSTVVEKLMLVVSELSEALEDLRKNEKDLHIIKYSDDSKDTLYDDEGRAHPKPIGFMSELADVVIRVGDLAGIVDGNLELAVKVKQAYNRLRPHMHGKVL